MLDEAGLTERASPLGAAASRLVMTWLAPLFRRYGDVTDPWDGAVSISGRSAEDVRSLLSQHADDLGETVCVVWCYEAAAVEMLYSDFVEHFDDLWYPARDDVWLLSFSERSFLAMSHEEFLLFGDLRGSRKFPVWAVDAD